MRPAWPEGERVFGCEFCWLDPIALWAVQRKVEPLGVLEVELRRQPVGRQWRRRRQRRGTERRFVGDGQFADGAGALAVVEQNRGACARRTRHIDENIDPAARRDHQRAVAGLERLGRLAVEGHDANLDPVQFDRDNRPLAGVDEAKPEPFVDSG